MPLNYLSTADDDLLEIYLTIAEHNEPAARRMIDRIRLALRRLNDFPFSAPSYPEIAADARGMAIGHYIALHRVVDGEVEIVRVMHTSRDFAFLAAADFAPPD